MVDILPLVFDPPTTVIDDAETGRRPRWVVVGLVAIVVAFIGFGSIHALQQPPFFAPDETAHVGYAQEVASFRLPEIRRFPEVPVEARQWQAERSTARDVEHRGVWVANHPPLNYVAVAPLIWYSRHTGALDGGLMMIRFANVAFAAVGVVFTFLLASELTGRNHRLALLSAALVALVPQGHAVFSQGLNDGLGFAAGTAVVWAGVRCLRRADALTRRDLALLAGTAVVAFGARAATMLVAVAVVGVVALHQLTRPAPTVSERGWRATVVVLIGLVPALLTFGWFYVRNIVLYGDIGASKYLLDLFGREDRGSVLDMFNSRFMWLRVYEGLMSPSTRERIVPPGSFVLTFVSALGVCLAFVTGRQRAGQPMSGDGSKLRWNIALCLVTLAVVATTIAQHASGGGNAHARYAMPAIGVAAVLVVIGLERIWTRWGPFVLVIIAGWWAVLNIPVDVNPRLSRGGRDDWGLPPAPLRVLPFSDAWRTGAGVLVFVGVVAAAGALIVSMTSGEGAAAVRGAGGADPGPDLDATDRDFAAVDR